MAELSATIYGTVPSKSNGYLIARRGRHSTLVKTAKLKKYEQDFFIQLPGDWRGANITDYFEFTVDVYYPSLRSDLDGCFKIILDCLQQAKAIKNDNRCVAIHARKFKDKKDPRILINLKTIDL